MPRVFLPPDLSLSLDPALFPLLFRAFGAPPALSPKKHRDVHAIARLLWGEEGSATLAEAARRLGVLAHPLAREAFREAAADARAQGHFDDGRIERALAQAGAPVAAWGAMRANELALRLLVAREAEEALETIFERVQHRLARSLPAHVPYELAARTPVPGGAVRADLVADALRDAARAESEWADAWPAFDEDGTLVVAVLRSGATEGAVPMGPGAAGPAPDRARRQLMEVDTVRFRPGEVRLGIATACPPLVFPYAAAVGSVVWGDPESLVLYPALTLKTLQVLGEAKFRKLVMPSPVIEKAIVALQLDDLRGTRTESRGARALAKVAPLLRAGGYLVRATFRFVIEGAPHPVDAYVELPRRLSISDPRYEAPVRAALAALGVFSPGAYGDDLTTLAPWVHPEWRWREVMTKATFDALVRAGILVPATAKESGARVAHEASRALAGNLRAFPLTNARDRGRHYAVAADRAVSARTVTAKDLVMWKLAMPARRARLRASMGLAEGEKLALPRGVGDLGRLALGGVTLRFVELVRGVGPREGKAVARAIRRAVGKEHAVVLVPEGKTLGGVLPEVSLDLTRQLGLGDYSDVIVRAARELRMEGELEPARFATKEAPLVIVREREEVWLGRVKLILTAKHFALFEALSDGKARTAAELGKKLSPGATDLANVVHKARVELDERVARSFREAGVELPEEWGDGMLVVKAGNRSFRLGVGCVVR